MQSFAEVKNGLRSKLEAATRAGNERTKKAIRVGIKYLNAATPVDTTEALSNWVVGLGEPRNAVIEPRGDTRAVSGGAVYSEADRVLRTKKAGQTAYLTNNAPHIGRLNAGSSKQAPAGFIEGAGLVMREALKQPSGLSKK